MSFEAFAGLAVFGLPNATLVNTVQNLHLSRRNPVKAQRKNGAR
jgi:hypothetical protein